MMSRVIREVTALAPGAEIGRVAMLWRVVEMPDGQYDLAPGHRMRLVLCSTAVGIAWAALALVARSAQNGGAYLAVPVRWIALSIFGTYRHTCFSLSSQWPSRLIALAIQINHGYRALGAARYLYAKRLPAMPAGFRLLWWLAGLEQTELFSIDLLSSRHLDIS
jgi:hypothetical protein